MDGNSRERNEVDEKKLEATIRGTTSAHSDDPISSAARGLAPYSMNKERNRNNERQAFD